MSDGKIGQLLDFGRHPFALQRETGLTPAHTPSSSSRHSSSKGSPGPGLRENDSGPTCNYG